MDIRVKDLGYFVGLIIIKFKFRIMGNNGQVKGILGENGIIYKFVKI